MENLVVSLADLTEELNKLSILKNFLDSQQSIDAEIDKLLTYVGWEIDQGGFSAIIIKTQQKAYVLPLDRGRVTLTKDFLKFYEKCKEESLSLIDIFNQYLRTGLSNIKTVKTYGISPAHTLI